MQNKIIAWVFILFMLLLVLTIFNSLLIFEKIIVAPIVALMIILIICGFIAELFDRWRR